MDERSKYLNFKDMFDGGGAGRSGDKFMGGGLLSMLGNALGIAPYGANRERDLEMAANVAAGVALKPEVATPVMRAEEMAYSGRGDYGMPQQPMQYGGRGDYGMPQQPMQYGGRGDYGMPQQPMQYSGRGNVDGSGMTLENAYVPSRPVRDMDTLLEGYLSSKFDGDPSFSSRLEDRILELFGSNVLRDVQSKVAAMPNDPMFVKFIEQQRQLEQKYGLERKSLADIEDMYQLQKMRGRF